MDVPPVDQEGSTLSASSPEKSVSTVSAKTTVSSWVYRKDQKRKNDKPTIPKDAFVTDNAETGRFQSRFRILPYSRASNTKFSGSSDKLVECIKSGGGLVINSTEEGLLPKESQDVIKILDVEYVRANMKETEDMVLPYDCFSSSFIWNQIYQRSTASVEKQDADLNLYRISPSALASYDANEIFRGAITWDDVQPISSEKLPPAIRIKKVALQIFPELVVCPPVSRVRRAYTRRDSQELLDKICEVDGHDRVLGLNLYQEIADHDYINRSALSMKEHFRKTVLPHLLENDGYYDVTPKDWAKFQMVANKEDRMELKRRKRARVQAQDEKSEED